jgi:glycosyltransferase involved in cell wall biosynthesis
MTKIQNTDNIKVCHIITGLNKGGAEVFLLQLCKAINLLSSNSCLIIGLSSYSEMLGQFKTSNLESTVLGMRKNPFSFFTKLYWTIQYCKQKRVNIIHAHMSHALIFAVLIKLFIPNLKIVFTAHSIKLSSKISEFIVAHLKRYRSVDIIFSESSKKSFNTDKISVIPNGIDFAKFMRPAIEKNKIFTFIAVGRLESMKNHIFLIENFDKLRNKEKVQIIILGEGTQRGILTEAIKRNGLQAKIFLPGKKDHISEYLHKSHCFLLPSIWEGFPISLLEAGATSLPCIVTKIQTVIDNFSEDSLFICSIERFPEIMDYVFENYVEALNRAQKLRQEIINNFGINQVAEKHVRLYRSVLAEA